MRAKLHIAVDVTPIRADGGNGGAKPFVLELLGSLAARGPHSYTLLTNAHNHQAFAVFEAKGMKRIPVDGMAPPIGLARLGFDVLFCPMTSPQFTEPGVATVCTLYDLQHLAYPWFFSGAELAHRTQFYQALCEHADAIVAISEFSRSALVGHFDVPVERTSVVPIAIHQRLAIPTAAEARSVLSGLGVPAAPFAFYPANFWPHKNHRFLFMAFERFLHDVPDADLHLVLTGDMFDRETEIRASIARMELADRVHLLGFVTDIQLAAIWREATLLVFPSLYEGFGIPVLEALQFGKPVLSSREGSLPEVGGDDVTYFDARDPQTLIDALREALDDLPTATRRAEAARQRIAPADSRKSADLYAQIFERVAAARPNNLRERRPPWSQRARDAVSRMNRHRRNRGAAWTGAGRAAWRRGRWSGLARAAVGVALAPEIIASAWLQSVTEPLVTALRRRHWILLDDTKRWLATAELHPDNWAGPTWIFEATIGPNDRALVLRAHPAPGTPFASQVLHAFIGDHPLGARPMPAADLFSVSWPLEGIGAGPHAVRIAARTFVVADDVLGNGDSRPLAYHVVWAGPSETDLPA